MSCIESTSCIRATKSCEPASLLPDYCDHSGQGFESRITPQENTQYESLFSSFCEVLVTYIMKCVLHAQERLLTGFTDISMESQPSKLWHLISVGPGILLPQDRVLQSSLTARYYQHCTSSSSLSTPSLSCRRDIAYGPESTPVSFWWISLSSVSAFHVLDGNYLISSWTKYIATITCLPPTIAFIHTSKQS